MVSVGGFGGNGVFGGNTVAVTSAGSGDVASVFVPVTPCRLMDTRTPIGPRATPIGAGETYVALVWGSNGQCVGIPATATAVSLNVTFTSPSADNGYATVFPADQPLPNTSNLNWSRNQAPAPNAVTSRLSADGKLGFYNYTGTVNLIADVVGYYIPATAIPTQPPQNVIWVAKSGGQFTSLSAAMNSITDTNPHLIMIAPGTYVETAPISLKTNVDIEGSGQDRTTITCACALANLIGQDSTIYVSGNVSAEIRDITITNSGGPAAGSFAVLLLNASAGMSIVDTTMTATNSPTSAAIALGVSSSDLPHIDRIRTYTADAGFNVGVYVENSGHVIVRNSWLYTSGSGKSFIGNGQSRLVTSTINGVSSGMLNKCDLVVDVNNNPYTCA